MACTTRRRMSPSGFVLIECLCYLAIVCVLMGLLFPCVVSIHAHVVHALGMQAVIMDTHMALDLIALDVGRTNASKKAWKYADNELALRLGNSEVQWIKQGNSLVRMSGTYKGSNRPGTMREKSLVLEHVKQVTYRAYEEKRRITYLDVEIEVEYARQSYRAHLAMSPCPGKAAA